MAAVVVALVYHFFLVLASRLGTVDVSDVLSALYFAQGHSDFEYFPCSALPLC